VARSRLDIKTQVAPIARIHCAGIRGTSHAPRKAPIGAEMAKGVQPTANWRGVHCLRICCHATEYQSRVPNDMKESNVAPSRGRKDGAFHTSSGTMGHFATLASQ
jgi:hypothetical protein